MPSKTQKRNQDKWAKNLRAKGLPVPVPKKGRSREPHDSRRVVGKGAESEPASICPTPERLAKHDAVAMQSGTHRSPPPIERMRDRAALDHQPHMNELMYQQAMELEALHRRSGLGGIAAQDLSKVAGGGDPAYMMPTTAVAADARRELIRRLNAMGWFADRPYRGAGRVVFAVVCLERTLGEAGRLHCGVSETRRAEAVAKDRLREGLMMLVDLAKIRKSTSNVHILGRTTRDGSVSV